MKVCLFGSYTVAEGYPVNRVLRRGLVLEGEALVECRAEVWGRFVHKLLTRATPWGLLSTSVRVAWGLVVLSVRYLRIGDHDWILVGYPGYLDVILARWLNRRTRPIVLVSFISLYDTAVCDRGAIDKGNWKARLLKALDARAFRAADIVLVDTKAQGDYYAELFDIERSVFVRSLVGEDDDVFKPQLPSPCRHGEALRVLFFGTYVPLHGIDTIIEAADLLGDEEIDFKLIGSGQEFGRLRERAAATRGRITFISEWVGSDELVEHIAAADICLGIFGTTQKAARVIPYKVYDALAIGRPVITRDSAAIRELLVDGESALLCPPGDAQALARAIRRLRDQPDLARRLADNGHQIYLDRGSPRAIGAHLLEHLRTA